MASSFIKICGVTRVTDAAFIISVGADYVGVIFAPASKRQVLPSEAASIVETVGPSKVVGVFRGNDESSILALVEEVGLTSVQLHDEPTDSFVSRLRIAGVTFIIRAFSEGDDVPSSDGLTSFDAILMDGPEPGSGVAATGLSSRDWARLHHHLILAGGLTPDNVEEIVATVRPWGVDVASGSEVSPGVKDSEKVASFVLRARRALTAKRDS